MSYFKKPLAFSTTDFGKSRYLMIATKPNKFCVGKPDGNTRIKSLKIADMLVAQSSFYIIGLD